MGHGLDFRVIGHGALTGEVSGLLLSLIQVLLCQLLRHRMELKIAGRPILLFLDKGFCFLLWWLLSVRLWQLLLLLEPAQVLQFLTRLEGCS